MVVYRIGKRVQRRFMWELAILEGPPSGYEVETPNKAFPLSWRSWRVIMAPPKYSSPTPWNHIYVKYLLPILVFPLWRISSSFKIHGWPHTHGTVNEGLTFLRDDPKLLDDGREISKSQGRGWGFDSRLWWNLLSTWHKTCRVVIRFLCSGVGMLTFCLKKKEKENKQSSF